MEMIVVRFICIVCLFVCLFVCLLACLWMVDIHSSVTKASNVPSLQLS